MQMKQVRRVRLGNQAFAIAMLAATIAFGGTVLAQEPAKGDANPASGVRRDGAPAPVVMKRVAATALRLQP